MTNDAIPLSEAALMFPAVNGRRPHRSTLRRWGVKGVRGVRLSIKRYGNRWYTTREAVAKFLKECNGDGLTDQDFPLVRPEPRGLPPAKRLLISQGYYGAAAKRKLLGMQKKG